MKASKFGFRMIFLLSAYVEGFELRGHLLLFNLTPINPVEETVIPDVASPAFRHPETVFRVTL